MLVAAADREALGVEVLEQRLGELAGGAELVTEGGERDRAAVSVGQRDHPLADPRERLGVIVEVPGDADCEVSLPQRREVRRIELGVERGFAARLPESLLERQG